MSSSAHSFKVYERGAQSQNRMYETLRPFSVFTKTTLKCPHFLPPRVCTQTVLSKQCHFLFQVKTGTYIPRIVPSNQEAPGGSAGWDTDLCSLSCFWSLTREAAFKNYLGLDFGKCLLFSEPGTIGKKQNPRFVYNVNTVWNETGSTV